MKTKLLIGIALCIGFAGGVASTIGYYLYVNRSTTICIATADLAGNWGLRIPAGTEMVYDRTMPGGFHTVRLYLNFDALTYNTKTALHVEQRRLLVPENWID